MKRFFLVAAVVLFSQSAFSQAWEGKGDSKIQVGLSALSSYGTGVVATYDYGLGGVVSIGAGANVYFSGYKDDNKDNAFFVFGRANFHLAEVLALPSQWDVYPGVDVGVLGGGFGLGAHAGVRYFFSKNIGAFLEVGNNSSIGISFNL